MDLKSINEVLDTLHSMKEIMIDHDNEIPIMCNYVISKLSLVIGSIRLDIVDLDRLAHVILIDLIKQLIS